MARESPAGVTKDRASTLPRFGRGGRAGVAARCKSGRTISFCGGSAPWALKIAGSMLNARGRFRAKAVVREMRATIRD